MSLRISDIYKFRQVIREVAGNSTPQGNTLFVTAAALIPPNSVVRYNSSNQLVAASNTTGNFSRLAGVTIAGAASGAQCEFYPDGTFAAFTGLTPGAQYFLDATGALTTSAAPANAVASIKIGYAPNASTLAVALTTFLL